MPPFSLLSLRRGLNNTDPPHAIGDDQCTVAMNVEFNKSMLGERRLGCTDVDLPTSITADANIQAVTFLHRHLPTTDETASELWVMGQHLTTQNVILTRKTTSWSTVTQAEAIDVTSNRGFWVSAQTLHGKLFLAYRTVGGVDRLHVWDGTTLRRCGLAEPAAPTVAETGAGTFSGIRYYRQREIVKSGNTVLRRSEPSDVTTYDPAGGGSNGAAARITKSADMGENATHWEAEASVDNANFYVIATTAVGTAFVDDSVVYATGYAASGYVLSEDTGDYALIHSGKFLSADEDRLIIGGSWENTALASRVSWTPVYGDPGDGNDERIPTDTDNFVDLDGFEGGPLTAMSNPVNGAIWCCKWSHTYQLVRTGQRSRAYEAVNISKSIGAIPGSLVEGLDQRGMPCLYGLDAECGPWRSGGQSIVQSASRDILTTWQTINLDGLVVTRAIYYPDSRQVHWWIATGSSNYPDLKLVLQTNATRETEDGVRGGWSLANGKIATAHAACLYADNIDDNVARSLTLRPFIGVTAANGYVLRCDTGHTDNGTAYAARIVTKPFIVYSLLQKFKVLAAALLSKADAAAQVKLTMIRDFGLEEPKTVTTAVAASASETDVVKQLRNFVGSQMYAIQVEFEDGATNAGQWQNNRIDARISDEDAA